MSHSSNLVSMSCDLLPLCCYNTQTSTLVELAVLVFGQGWVVGCVLNFKAPHTTICRDEVLVMNVAATPPYT